MKSKEHQLSDIQFTMKDYDLESCKFVATWLLRHIQLHEIDFTTIDAGIEDMGLSERAYNVLKQNNITSLQELLITASNVYNTRILDGAGKITTQEIQEKAMQFQDKYVFKDKNKNMRSRLKDKTSSVSTNTL